MKAAKEHKPQQSRTISRVAHSQLLQLEDWSRGELGGRRSKVDWTTGSINGTTVGIKMNAYLGPEHKQGGPPKTNAQKDLMNNLPTTPTLTNPYKYIKGHLLNDNVGGPGEDFNLFPITAAANKEHESSIEHDVKEWVNDEKHWVKYNVEVTDINNQIINSQPTTNNFINCKFRCHANVMATDLNGYLYDSNRSVDATITSEYKADSTVEKKYVLGNFPSIIDRSRLGYTPLLSTSNSKIKLDPALFEFIKKLKMKNRLSDLKSIPQIGKKTIRNIFFIKNYDINYYPFFTAEQKRAIHRLHKIGLDKLSFMLLLK